MKNKFVYIILGAVLGAILTVSVGMSVQAFADKDETEQQEELRDSHEQEQRENEDGDKQSQEEIDGILKSLSEHQKDIRNEFYSAEQNIDNHESADKNIENIENKLKNFDRTIFNIAEADEKREVYNGYKTALEDLREANDKVKKGEHVNQGIIDDIHYNLMENHRAIVNMERDDKNKNSY